ncbi:MAG: PEP-CTERM sorting domain-containing protein [Desulfobacula sp.]|jgi:hypothetical protein|nr:PEP-CTERM sorting domain-containing protein [Desulfobacula sp.]
MKERTAWLAAHKSKEYQIMKKTIFLVILLCLFYPVIGSATTVQGISDVVGYADMDGMEVTVVFGDGNSEIKTWGTDISTSTSGVTGDDDDWSLTFTGDDSFPEFSTDQWAFQSDNTNGIDSITINALAGDTVFDIIWGTTDAEWYTVGSFFGYWTYNHTNRDTDDPVNYKYDYFDTDFFGPSDTLEALWTFSDPISVDGATTTPSEQDVYGTLTIDFLTTATDPDFTFTLDSDQVVPEPGTILLFGLGLLGFSAVSRKKHMA